MSRSRISVDSHWWYATIGIVVLLVLYLTQSPPDTSFLLLGLNIVIVFAMAACWILDIRAIRGSESEWNPSFLYAFGALFTPILLLYGYRRYQYLGLV
ncbi:hypothetical protein D3261_08505 [Halococcus sp. IIIV-5B]|nr:hypothetical protein D3261_08505 [Halococcus sp. IIIV-5B]